MSAEPAAVIQGQGHRHPCDVKGCHGAECFAGRIEGCGHPDKSMADSAAGGAVCPWGPWPCPAGDPT